MLEVIALLKVIGAKLKKHPRFLSLLSGFIRGRFSHQRN